MHACGRDADELQHSGQAVLHEDVPAIPIRVGDEEVGRVAMERDIDHALASRQGLLEASSIESFAYRCFGEPVFAKYAAIA